MPGPAGVWEWERGQGQGKGTGKGTREVGKGRSGAEEVQDTLVCSGGRRKEASKTAHHG